MSTGKKDVVRATVEHGLERFRADRKVSLSLRDALFTYQAIGEFIAFFHQPEHWKSIEDVQRFVGTKDSGGLGVLWSAYYDRLRDIWPPDVAEALDRGDLDMNNDAHRKRHTPSRASRPFPHVITPQALQDKRIVLAGLLADRVDADLEMELLANEVRERGATVVATLIQRRGVSRSRRPGGAAAAHEGRALNGSSFICPGKLRELQSLCASEGADLVVFYNRLSDSQRARIGQRIGVAVFDRLTLGLVRDDL
ncbi:MAG: hypothetical protein U0441_24915 [Polyangiaceae bacterium]